MSTLYQRVQHFYTVDWFRFKPKNLKFMGYRIAALWREMHPDVPPNIQESHEDGGVFMVANYHTLDFDPIIDQLIRNCKQEILDAARRRNQKPQLSPPSSPSKIDSSAPLVSKPMRKRTRKPVWKSK